MLHLVLLELKGEQEANLFVVSVLRPVLDLYLSRLVFVCCQSCRGWFPSPIGLARRHTNEIPLSTTLNPNQTIKQNLVVWTLEPQVEI